MDKRFRPKLPARAAMETPLELGDIIAQLRKTTDLGTQMDQAAIWEKWPEIVGDPLWFHGKPVKFRRKKLYIEVDSPPWMHNYAYVKPDILSRINGLAGYELVQDLHLSLQNDPEADEAQDAAAE